MNGWVEGKADEDGKAANSKDDTSEVRPIRQPCFMKAFFKCSTLTPLASKSGRGPTILSYSQIRCA